MLRARVTFRWFESTRVKRAAALLATASGVVLAVYGIDKDPLFNHGRLKERFWAKLSAQEISRPRIVVLGSGWGSTSFLKHLDTDAYDVTVISPTNNFYYTPLLPAACVGTVENRSIVEPIRRILYPLRAKYVQGYASDVDFGRRTVSVDAGNEQLFDVPYDLLLMAVGSTSNTYGLQGVHEHCHVLKSVADARKIRKKIMHNLELASLPTTPPDERKRLLTFVVCGGGPTGIEFAAELHDYFEEDITRYFSHLIKDVAIHVIQSGDHVLNTFDRKISDYTENKFGRDGINIITHARVTGVQDGNLNYTLTHSDRSKTNESLPFGFCLWSTGIGMCPLRMLHVNDRLLLQGTGEHGGVYAIGDCATIELPRLKDKMEASFAEADENRDGTLSFAEFRKFAKRLADRHPIVEEHLEMVVKKIQEFDSNGSKSIDQNEFRQILEDVDKKLRVLPATAQAASQQGKYIARKFNHFIHQNASGGASGPELLALLKKCDESFPIFKYHHLGSLAYIGNESGVADLGKWVGTGWIASYLWRGSYFTEQVSMRTRVLLALDWCKRKVFGRDISEY